MVCELSWFVGKKNEKRKKRVSNRSRLSQQRAVSDRVSGQGLSLG